MTIISAEVPASGRARRASGLRSEATILQAAERVFAERGFKGASMSEIAAAAHMPKPNLHYYFGTKEALYRAVLTDILETWLGEADAFVPDGDPAQALGSYVRAKMRWSRERPHASRVFANEVLHGALFIGPYLSDDLRRRVEQKGKVIEGWIRGGRMARVDPRALFFMLWAMTQTWADFAVQVHAVLGVADLSEAAYDAITEEVVAFALRGCGLDADGRPPAT
ncbi:TetR/AcrR family transcriptional regulator [Arenibaculum pallidiluteum]|uniref:TetR/AcrR family transcriptional regulator n=1 Tax=Arenibaculum pallidiluteum TaxID=2812559 RepID=UPI001A95DD0D|nr:TetR/AcrR family transcriptional regulator [Arenibaculum pallidiluteum]